MMEIGAWVYIMTNRPNGILYVGCTTNLQRRAWEHRESVAAGDITVSIRLWQRAKVKAGGRYASHGFSIEVDSIEHSVGP